MNKVAIISTCAIEAEPGELLPVPGFVESQFSPLVYACFKQLAAAQGCRLGGNSAIVLGSCYGDTTTADLASRNLAAGQHHNALLFYQSVPSSITGYIAQEYGITGPISCISGYGGMMNLLIELASSMLCGEEVETAVLIQAELAGGDRVRATAVECGADADTSANTETTANAGDHAAASVDTAASAIAGIPISMQPDSRDRAAGLVLMDADQAQSLGCAAAYIEAVVIGCSTEEACIGQLMLDKSGACCTIGVPYQFQRQWKEVFARLAEPGLYDYLILVEPSAPGEWSGVLITLH
ncbi:hypothetical protein K0T92_21525 [Paenibacillus oenotherae]|uniref:Beta-ketoacyl synthase N-terminal domain-containing protein n=1 Tax=Paenibacillus oenotherae TaxID=1435645 RepID=A0ABS7DBI4_9BACL|nr:hypothetical protein [Paenibacillus oenotherae]MBW7477303.1 hypothetical protein [Paenibacillus oenotherae]